MIRSERRDGGIAWITIDRPQARNAMTFAMWDDLRDCAFQLDADSEIRAVVFIGAGTDAFVAGTDIAEFRAFAGADDGVAYEARIERVIAALEAIRVPTIAAIAGACTGGGVSIAAACDLRIGAPGTRIGVPIARTLGNTLSIRNIARVAAIVGLDRVRTLLLTGTLLDTEAALRCGFLTDVAASDETLSAYAADVAKGIAALAPLTLRATKELCRRLRAAQIVPDAEDVVRSCYGSADFQEGIAAFLDKRQAAWKGR